MYTYTHVYVYVDCPGPGASGSGVTLPGGAFEPGLYIRSMFTLRIVGPRIFESTFRNYCSKKLDGALRKSTSFV